MWFTTAEILVAFWFFFHPIIIIGFLYWRIFREWPFPRGYKWSSDLKWLKSFRSEVIRSLVTESEFDKQQHEEGDYYDDYDGLGTNSGPSVRHPKNRDRAYSGGSKRFHDGGRQDAQGG